MSLQPAYFNWRPESTFLPVWCEIIRDRRIEGKIDMLQTWQTPPNTPRTNLRMYTLSPFTPPFKRVLFSIWSHLFSWFLLLFSIRLDQIIQSSKNNLTYVPWICTSVAFVFCAVLFKCYHLRWIPNERVPVDCWRPLTHTQARTPMTFRQRRKHQDGRYI